jgi:hypothetical protein
MACPSRVLRALDQVRLWSHECRAQAQHWHNQHISAQQVYQEVNIIGHWDSLLAICVWLHHTIANVSSDTLTGQAILFAECTEAFDHYESWIGWSSPEVVQQYNYLKHLMIDHATSLELLPIALKEFTDTVRWHIQQCKWYSSFLASTVIDSRDLWRDTQGDVLMLQIMMCHWQHKQGIPIVSHSASSELHCT